jgi:hypothetical protein
MDLVVGTVWGSIYTNTGLAVLTNDGAGNFTTLTKLYAAAPGMVVVADLNGDKKADVVALESSLSRAAVFFQVPQLTVVQSAGTGLVSWPMSWTNWVLQSNLDLSTPNWMNIDNVLNDGTNKSVVVPASTNDIYFRLVPP